MDSRIDFGKFTYCKSCPNLKDYSSYVICKKLPFEALLEIQYKENVPHSFNIKQFKLPDDCDFKLEYFLINS